MGVNSFMDRASGVAHGVGEIAAQCAMGTASFYAAVAYALLRDHSESSMDELIADLEKANEICEKIDSVRDRVMQAVLQANLDSLVYQKARSMTVTGGSAYSFLRDFCRSFGGITSAGFSAVKNVEKAKEVVAKEINRFHVGPASREAESHILEGHMHPGMPGKTAFPSNWERDDIMNHVNSIPNNSKTSWQ